MVTNRISVEMNVTLINMHVFYCTASKITLNSVMTYDERCMTLLMFVGWLLS